ncbi:hypothetical protein JQN83_26875 [Micromonospora sp. MMS20-R2-23]|uniref:Uncharacterized protein n=1 Tax=Micromonospora antibiotica TaxID=2807623 RepID=A0ABS3VFK2_9ACTN|nr:hypothetical protein [Micromonospora antibiotica]MBO4164408.1 hypothetical protein [Micromonospora antibiotica]
MATLPYLFEDLLDRRQLGQHRTLLPALQHGGGEMLNLAERGDGGRDRGDGRVQGGHDLSQHGDRLLRRLLARGGTNRASRLRDVAANRRHADPDLLSPGLNRAHTLSDHSEAGGG